MYGKGCQFTMFESMSSRRRCDKPVAGTLNGKSICSDCLWREILEGKSVDATLDVIPGDTIAFKDGLYLGDSEKSQKVGERIVVAKVLKCTSNGTKVSSLFSLQVLNCEGDSPLQCGEVIHRKAKSLYVNGTQRLVWEDEENRKIVKESLRNAVSIDDK